MGKRPGIAGGDAICIEIDGAADLAIHFFFH